MKIEIWNFENKRKVVCISSHMFMYTHIPAHAYTHTEWALTRLCFLNFSFGNNVKKNEKDSSWNSRIAFTQILCTAYYVHDYSTDLKIRN